MLQQWFSPFKTIIEALLIAALFLLLSPNTILAQQRDPYTGALKWNPNDPYMCGGPGWPGGDRGRLNIEMSPQTAVDELYHILNNEISSPFQIKAMISADEPEFTHCLSILKQNPRMAGSTAILNQCRAKVQEEGEIFSIVASHRNGDVSGREQTALVDKGNQIIEEAKQLLHAAVQMCSHGYLPQRSLIVRGADGTHTRIPLPIGLPGEPTPYGNYTQVDQRQTPPPTDPGAFGAQPGERLFSNPDIWLHTGNIKLGLAHILDEHVPGAKRLDPQGVFFTNAPEAITELIDVTILANRRVYGRPKPKPNGVKIFFAEYPPCFCNGTGSIGTSYGKPVNWVQVIVAPRNVVITAYPTAGPP